MAKSARTTVVLVPLTIGYDPAGCLGALPVVIQQHRLADVAQASGVSHYLVSGLHRGHGIYDPLLFGPAQRSRGHCLLNGGYGILRRQRRHWAVRPSILDRGWANTISPLIQSWVRRHSP